MEALFTSQAGHAMSVTRVGLRRDTPYGLYPPRRSLASAVVIFWYHFMRTELVTTLRRQATELLSELERDRQPILITQHGVPRAYLVDVATFESLQRRMSLLEGIARGERAIEEGRTVSHAEAKRRMGRWLQ